MTEFVEPIHIEPESSTGKKGKSKIALLIALGSVLFLTLGSCFFSFYFLFHFSKNQKTKEGEELVKEHINHPMIVKYIGELKSVEPVFFDKERDSKYDDTYIIVGSKGKGKLLVMRIFRVPLEIKLVTEEDSWVIYDIEDEFTEEEYDDEYEEIIDYVTPEVKNAYFFEPLVVNEIGLVEDVSFNDEQTVYQSSRNSDPNTEILVFDMQGSKKRGTLIITIEPLDNGFKKLNGRLVTDTLEILLEEKRIEL